MIERTCSDPMISVPWSASREEVIRGRSTRQGRIPEFGKVIDEVRERRRKSQTEGEYEAAQICEYFLRYHQAPNRGVEEEGGDYTHNILDDMARWCERRGGRINPHAQAILRECLDAAWRKERLGC
jgi:hypothetical protein